MIGNNTLELNQATVMAALQHYFDTVLFATGQSPLVVSVDCRNKISDNGFQVGVKERPADTKTGNGET